MAGTLKVLLIMIVIISEEHQSYSRLHNIYFLILAIFGIPIFWAT